MMDNSICNEELELAPNYGEVDLDSFLKNIGDDDLYKSFIYTNEPQINTLESVLPPLNNDGFSDTPLGQMTNFMSEVKTNYTPPKPAPTYTPVPIVNTTSILDDIKRKTKTSPTKKQKLEKEQKPKVVKEDDKYMRRLQANKKSAQASRERKKALKVELEAKLQILTRENASLHTQTTQLETENKVLKNEFIQLQNLINDSTVMSKLLNQQLNNNSNNVSNNAVNTNNSNNLNITTPSNNNVVSFTTTTQQEEIIKPINFNNNNNNAAAALYLMIVLHSFGQHFNKITMSSPSINNSINSNTVSVI